MKKLVLYLSTTIIMVAKTQSIVLGAGCFWGVEKYFEKLNGVVKATSGYAGGSYDNPTYRTVLKYRDREDIVNHTEVVEVVYEDTILSTEMLIKRFWELHDPTQGNRQGNDRGNNYRSALYYTTKAQKEIALRSKSLYQKLLHQAGYGSITTEIKPLKRFYKAESYHQDYLKKNPNGYCPNHATGVKFGKARRVEILSPLGGKEIVLIDAVHCTFCKKFKREVSDRYQGTIPLRIAEASTLQGFTLKGKIEGTPTLLFVEDGKVIYQHTGYMDEKRFYKVLGAFKLGSKSEAFNVAFHQGTDARFCRQYEKFKNTGDGVFVDSISGDILFDTRDRFNSGSGWLSFFKAVEGATVQKADHSFGMRRVEVLAKKSGIHLGHVFNDAPGGRQRFCINATILEFVPRDKVPKR